MEILYSMDLTASVYSKMRPKSHYSHPNLNPLSVQYGATLYSRTRKVLLAKSFYDLVYHRLRQFHLTLYRPPRNMR